jgi:hypothetical protein
MSVRQGQRDPKATPDRLVLKVRKDPRGRLATPDRLAPRVRKASRGWATWAVP